MQKFIGIDVHSASSTVAVISSSGRKLGIEVVQTSAQALIAHVKSITGKKHVCIEEGHQLEWLYEVLSPHVVEVVVANVSGMQRAPLKNDAVDAFTCANELRLGLIKKRVFKKRGELGELRALVRHYDKVVADHVRMQNRLKALFRGRGIVVEDTAYSKDEQSRLLELLPAHLRLSAQLALSQFIALTESRQAAEKAMLTEAKKHAQVKRLCTVPGLAHKRAAQLLAVVVDAHRFASKRQFWSYCGFAVDTEVSGEWAQLNGGWKRVKKPMTRGLSLAFNRPLKAVFNGAAETVIQTANSKEPLYNYYRRLLDGGTNPDLARLSLARKIAAISLAVMKKQEVYNSQLIQRANNMNES